MSTRFKAALTALAFIGSGAVAHGQVARFEISAPPSPAFEGRSFGTVGAYERIAARATLAVDPANRRNSVIADIELAPRNAEGRVEAVADVVILRPVDRARANGTMLVDVPNRGRKLALQLFNDAPDPSKEPLDTAAGAGNGFLMRQGYTLVWVGWQGDIPSQPNQLALAVPVLQGVTGSAREEIQFDHLRDPAVATLAWPAAEPANAAVSVRALWDRPRQMPADLSIRFVAPNRIEVTRPQGFDAGALYEITYTARDPKVLGLGYAAMRDVASFLRHETGDANPLAGRISHATLFGVSQSGRFVRTMLHLGFNEDMAGRRVYDAMMPHVAGARRLSLNTRFAQPGRNARHPQDPVWEIETFPFTYAETEDPFTGKRDSLMARCRASGTCPRVMQTDSEFEWWGARASLVVTDPRGEPLALPDDVRVYMMTGTPHFAVAGEAPRRIPQATLPLSPVHAGGPARALLAALEAWMRDGTAPPPSRTPRREDGTMVDAAEAVPDIPGLGFAGLHAVAAHVDPKPVPPVELGRYKVFVPAANADGISRAGIRTPLVDVPRATYTAWNPRAEGYGKGALYWLQGGVLPFAATRAERAATRDPRPALEERYPTLDSYVAAVKASAERLAAERLLLPEDVVAMTQAAAAGTLDRSAAAR